MKRLPIIRHIRFLIAFWKFHRYWDKFARWLISAPEDEQYLRDI